MWFIFCNIVLKLLIMKKILGIIIVCFFGLHLFAQENALLWEIKKDGFYTSYLYGTIHLSDERVFQFGDSVLPKLYSCNAYAGEIILQPEDMLKMLPYLFEKDKNKQCKNVLNEEEFALVSAAFQEKLGEHMVIVLPMMSPYLASVLISFPMSETESNSKLFLDAYLQAKADSLGKKLISLESIESQFSYIEQIDIEDQKAHLLKVVNNKEEGEDSVEDLIVIYENEDISAMKELLLKYEDEDPIMTEDFMNERNIIHKNGMITAMKEQSTFTAVGAAHLVGITGIIELLRAEGFSVEPIFK